MIEVQVGKIGRASVENRVWTCDVDTLQKVLQLETDGLFIHGGVPDADEFIVQEIIKRMPYVTVIRATEPAEDPEAIDPESGERGTD